MIWSSEKPEKNSNVIIFLYHLRKVDGKVGDLAKISGMERTNLYRKLRALNINPKNADKP